MPCEGSGLASVERKMLPATRLKAAPRVSSRPSPLSMNSLRCTLLWIVVVAVEPPLPSSPVSITPAPPRLATMRLSSTALPLARWISTPMQKLRISSPRISTPWVSTAARPGLVVVRTLAPYWPGAAPAQVCWPLSSMKPEPSSATNVAGAPPRHAFDAHRALDGGQQRCRLDDVGTGALGVDLDAEAAGRGVVAFDRPAQRASSPSSAVRVTRSVSAWGASAPRRAGESPTERAQSRREQCGLCNFSSRSLPGACTDRRRAARLDQRSSASAVPSSSVPPMPVTRPSSMRTIVVAMRRTSPGWWLT